MNIMLKELSPLKLHVTGTDPELFDWLVEDSKASPGLDKNVFSFHVDENPVQLMCGDVVPEGGGGLDGCLCLIRFVDHQSMQKLASTLKMLSDCDVAPVYFLIYRKSGEPDFKMSCPFCGQKLWVRDADVDKRGRCPTCKKGFTLPKQEDQVIDLLSLKQMAAIHRVIREDDASFLAAFRLILKRKEERDTLDESKLIFRESAATMPVNLD